jgi:selenocysteine lyase/cysteine desulfurase
MALNDSKIASPKDQHRDSLRSDSAFTEFKRVYPQYEDTRSLDELREKEFSRLDETGHAYLDYTGGGLYANSQLDQHLDILKRGIFGNPHSNNPSSLAITHLDQRARASVLEYFNASSEEYVVIFTQNASGALKLVGESYPFDGQSRYLLTFDNHNAANGIREFARSKGASITYVPVDAPELRINVETLKQHLERPAKGHNLFVFPAQSNFSGVQHPLEWIQRAQSLGWDVLVDAAAFVPTNRLDLGVWHPDFVPLSFYKMFGYPTGVGCLIAKKSALKKLHRPWFSGGTIKVVSVQGDSYYLADGEMGFEDGTINYLNLPAVEIGLKFLSTAGIDRIHERVIALSGWLIENLSSLRHKNGFPVVEIYGPHDTAMRGATIAMNFHDPTGKVFNFHEIEESAGRFKISLRTGCFCNPGAGEIAFGLTKSDMSDCFENEERASFEQCIIASKGKTAGAVRVSLGIVSNFSDAYRFLEYCRTFVNKTVSLS